MLWQLTTCGPCPDGYGVAGLSYAPEGQIEQEGQPASLEKKMMLLNRLGHVWLAMLKLSPSADNPNYTFLGDQLRLCLNVLAEKQE